VITRAGSTGTAPSTGSRLKRQAPDHEPEHRDLGRGIARRLASGTQAAVVGTTATTPSPDA
jgi:predicted N-formylglutamate amidohydrolase